MDNSLILEDFKKKDMTKTEFIVLIIISVVSILGILIRLISLILEIENRINTLKRIYFAKNGWHFDELNEILIA